ncbi:hypothetical protein V8C86DRAFT_2801711 [Haematococcus lacustris]|nr:hypothetical protein QJQ45_010447 [Haematococcus lacustris]
MSKRKRGTNFAELWHSTELSNVRIVLQPQLAPAPTVVKPEPSDLYRGRPGPWPPGTPGPPLLPGPPAPPPLGALPPSDVMIYAHDTVLFVSSEYWKTRVMRWRHEATQCGNAAAALAPMTLAEHVSQEELLAAQAVLRLMYSCEVTDEEAKQPLLLAQMMNLSDRWKAPACMQLCMEAFALCAKNPSSLQAISQALPLIPDSARQLEEYSAVAGSAAPHLLVMFGNVHAVISGPSLLGCWLDLPYAFVHQWASSDELAVDSEDSVVVLLAAWLAGPLGSKSSSEQERQLARLVRLQHVSCAYQVSVLPWIGWFEDQHNNLMESVTCMAALGTPLEAKPHLPAAWTAPPRQHQLDVSLLPSSSHRLEVSVMELWRAYSSVIHTKNVEWFVSAPRYLSGAWWQLGLQVGSTPTGGGEHKLAAWVGIRLVPAPAAFAKLPRVRGVACSFHISHLPPNVPNGQLRLVHRGQGAFVTYQSASGAALLPEATSSEMFNRQVIRDGKLTLTATVTCVHHRPDAGTKH